MSYNFLCIDDGYCTVFTEEPQDEEVVQNEIAQFMCSVDCMTPHYTTWTYISLSGSSVLIANASQVAANSSKYSLSTLTGILAVHNVTYADRGIFTCTITTDLAVLTSSALLIVKGNCKSNWECFVNNLPSHLFSSTSSTNNRKCFTICG